MEDQLKNIIEKVESLYMRYGIRSVTMDDVARQLGISKKTLYTYVKDKRELVELVVEEQFKKQKESDACLRNKNLSALDEILEVYHMAAKIIKEINPSYQYDLKKYYPHLCDKFMNHKRDNVYISIKSNLIKGKEEGVYRADLDEEIIARMHASRHFSLMDMEQEEVAFFVENNTFKELFIYHIHGILNDKGREILNQKNFFKK